MTDVIESDKFAMKEILILAASAEKGSEHPLGEAIVNKAKEQNLNLLNPADFRPWQVRASRLRLIRERSSLGM